MEERKITDVRGGENATFVGDLLSTCVKYFKWVVLVIVVGMLVSGVRTVGQGEVAVILRFGKLSGDTREEQIHQPGLLLAFPYIIDEVVTVPVSKVFELTVDTHYTSGEMSSAVEQNGYCITGDNNVVLISTSLKYTISDPVAYALYNRDVASTVKGVISGSLTRYAAGANIDTLLTDGKDEMVEAVQAESQALLDSLGCGVLLSGVEIGTVAPPAEVKDVFDGVNSSTVRVQTMLAQAEQYREVLIPSVQAQADSNVSTAIISQSVAVGNAQQTMSEFYGLLEEYEKDPNKVIVRVYYEKLAALYEKIGVTYVVDGDGTPHIVVP